MLSLLGAFLGFFTSTVPQFLKMWQDKKDKEHELAMMDKTAEINEKYASQRSKERIEEINTAGDIELDKEDAKALTASVTILPIQLTGNTWVDGITSVMNNLIQFYNGTVRPTVTYSFFGLYAWVKYEIFLGIHLHQGQPLATADLLKIWTDEDMALFVTIVTFWFGHRMMGKYFGKKAA